MRWSVLPLFLTFILVSACKPEVSETVKAPKVLEKKTIVEKKEKGPDIPDRIFGLPVPQNSFSHFKIGDSEAVLVKTRLETIKYFYQKNLVDYEIVEQDRKLFIIGLRSFMASAEVYFYTNRKQSPLIIKFSPPKTEFEKAELQEKPDARKAGSEVKLRTKTGELVAPGARWNEPYTPPFGTPLHKERYRLNWGKPFGKWKAQ